MPFRVLASSAVIVLRSAGSRSTCPDLQARRHETVWGFTLPSARAHPTRTTDWSCTTQPFLLTLNDIIHSEVRKLYPGAEVPEFDFDDRDPAYLLLGYRSARRLCALAEGFIIGAAHYYGEEASLDQQRCMHRGDDRCVIRCAFTPAGP
jgi:hypothetical protein